MSEAMKMLVKSIMIFIIVSTMGLAIAQAAPPIESVVRNHRARVKDFNEYLKRRNMKPSREGVSVIAEYRRKQAEDREKARKAFAAQRKQIDPLLEEKRDRLYLAEIEAREKAKEKLRKQYVEERNQVRRAVAKEAQIDEMVEFRLVD
jgi:hypothetical protein